MITNSRTTSLLSALGANMAKPTHFRLAAESDAAFILELRTNPELNRHLHATAPDLDAQKKWLSSYKERETAGTEFYFIIVLNGADVGCVRLYDFQGDSFCWGSWIIKPGTPSQIAYQSALLVYEYGFYTLGFNRSHFDVRKANMNVHRFHSRMGAKIIREDDQNFYFDYPREAYEEVKPQYSRFLV